jgi:hypothetical protein
VFPKFDRLLVLLREKRIGNGLSTYARHRIVRDVMAMLKMSPAHPTDSKPIPGKEESVTAVDVIEKWGNFTSVKSYRNKLKTLCDIGQAALVALPHGDYANQTLRNINAPLEDIIDNLSKDEPYPVGYDIAWAELCKVIRQE